MKKFLSLVLAAMMLLSCTSAFAENVNGAVQDVSKFLEVPAGSNFNVTENKTASQSTDLWLQVEANGQIDVTVPLVLVFKTNIDGGDASVPETYKMINNNNTNLVLTKVAVTDLSGTDANPMTLVTKNTPVLADDTYYVVLTPEVNDTEDVIGEFDLFSAVEDGTETTDYEVLATEGGLLALNKKTTGAEATATDTVFNVYMKTGRLNFVTKLEDNDEYKMDETQGVHLLTVTYTIGINTEDQYGDDIAGTYEGTKWEKGTTEGATYEAVQYEYTYNGAENEKITVSSEKK